MGSSIPTYVQLRVNLILIALGLVVAFKARNAQRLLTRRRRSARCDRKNAKRKERLTSIAWERVRHLRPPSGVAIVVWASSNGDILTNADLLKLMAVSRSVSTALAKMEARAYAEFEATIAGSELEEAMWNWCEEDVEPSEPNDVLPHQGSAMTVERDDFAKGRLLCKAWREFWDQGFRVKLSLHQAHVSKLCMAGFDMQQKDGNKIKFYYS